MWKKAAEEQLHGCGLYLFTLNPEGKPALVLKRGARKIESQSDAGCFASACHASERRLNGLGTTAKHPARPMIREFLSRKDA